MSRLVPSVWEEGDSVDERVAKIAGRQHGIASFEQLVSAGMTKSVVGRRASNGQLHRLYRGVYAVGHRASSREATWMAAVLACGDGAVLSHTSAAVLWDLLKPMSGPTDLSLPSQNGRAPRQGMRIHRLRSLPPSFRTKRLGIPVTTVPRTLTDLAAAGLLEPRLLRNAIRQAQLRGYRLDPRLRALTRRTRSDLELDFLAFCRLHRLPPPEVNVRVGRFTADFLYRDAGFLVETDSWDYHAGEAAFEEDHERDLTFRAAGLEPLRFTGGQLEREGDLVAAEIRRRLAEAERRFSRSERRLAGP